MAQWWTRAGMKHEGRPASTDRTQLHRVGQPAVINAKIREFFVNGKRHRIDGPYTTNYTNEPVMGFAVNVVNVVNV